MLFSKEVDEERARRESSELVTVPVVLSVCALVATSSGLGALAWLCGMLFHEVGHALGFWLSSRVAVPTFGMAVPFQGEPSPLTFLVLLGLGALWSSRAYRAGYLLLAAIPVALLPCLVGLSWIFPLRVADELILLAGQGGELVLAALAIILFFHPMPRRFNWGLNRFVFLFLAGCSLARAAGTWLRASQDIRHLPTGGLFDFGRIFHSNAESNGDMDRLMREFGWSAEGLVSFYTGLTIMTLGALVVFYLILLYQRLSPRSPHPALTVKR